jgi:uncharacterized protein (DUF1697 family)
MKRAGVHVALMRGINIGGKHRVSMKDLAALCTAAGCREVETYIQSGNVVCDAPESLARKVPKAVAAALQAKLGFAAPIVLRSGAEMMAMAATNPYLRRGVDPATLYVAFLADPPEAARVKTLDPARSPPDTFEVLGRDVFICCPNGVGNTKLHTTWFDTKLDTISTARNWRTCMELAARAAARLQ